MADTKDAPTKKRRIIRKVETVREKAEKNAENAKTPAKSGVFRQTLRFITMPFRYIGKQIARLGRHLNKFKVFRIIGYIFVPPYVRNSWKELRQVTWPARKETFQLTWAVLIFAVAFGLFVAAADYGLDKIFKRILLNE